jgi:hypothetical protein
MLTLRCTHGIQNNKYTKYTSSVIYIEGHHGRHVPYLNVLIISWFMVYNGTFNTISVISWRSVLLVEETGVPGENNQPVASD